MTTIAFTEFRQHASDMIDRVERGEALRIMRHGRPVAEISPVAQPKPAIPAWKRPGLKLAIKGASLSDIILEERG